MNEIRITAITIYPIKSTAGISVDECGVEAQGLSMDRRWLLVDEDGEFLRGAAKPNMTTGLLGFAALSPTYDDAGTPYKRAPRATMGHSACTRPLRTHTYQS